MMKHVLIPLDGSPLAEGALQYAKAVCRENTHVTLLRVLNLLPDSFYVGTAPELGVPVGDYPVLRDEHIHAAETYLKDLRSKYQNAYANIDTAVVDSRDTVDAILEFCDENAVDGIVMVTHGRSGLGRLLMGSITEKVLHAALCPVLVVPRLLIEDEPEAAPQAEANPIVFGDAV